MTLAVDEIRSALHDLATRLAEQDLTVTIHVVGGAAVALGYHPERQATRDVDAWVNTAAGTHPAVIEAAARLAIDRGWPDGWLNEDVVMFIPESVGGLGDPAWRPFLAVDDVSIVLAQPRLLFAMKLRAARGRRDLPDLAVLAAPAGIGNVNAAVHLYDEYYPDDELKPAAREWLRVFFADDGASPSFLRGKT